MSDPTREADIGTLLTTAYALTHKMHVMHREDLREQRDLITAEITRRDAIATLAVERYCNVLKKKNGEPSENRQSMPYGGTDNMPIELLKQFQDLLRENS